MKELSSKINSVEPSLTLQITAKAKALKAKGEDVISFGAGEPDFDTPECIKKACVDSINSGFTKYTPASGIPDLKHAIAQKLKSENGLDYNASQIVVSCGAKHSLFNVFQVLLNEGDEVIIPAPFWLSYPEMVKLGGGTPIVVDTKQEKSYKVSVDDLKPFLSSKTKALILTSPSNPTGAVYSKDELQAIAGFAEENDIYVISDEIYENLLYDGVEHVSIASLGDKIKDLAILVNGVSKSYAMTGWRIGYLAANEKIAKAVGTLQSHSTSNPTSFAQVGAVVALKEARAEVDMMVTHFARRRDLIVKELASIDKIKVFKPSGAFYVFCDVSATGLSAMDFATRVLDEAKVAVIPSEPFGCDSHIRLSFAISDEAIVSGIKRIKEWINKL